MSLPLFRRSVTNSRHYFIACGLCAIILPLLSSPVQAQTPVPSPTPIVAGAPADPVQETGYLAFRQQMLTATEKADNGDLKSATKALGDAIMAGGYHFELPKLTRVLSDNEKSVPPALLKSDAVSLGIPYWTLEALVRNGDRETALEAARKQTDPESRYRALALVAVAQAGRYLNTPYALPPVVLEKPEQWTAKTDVTGSKPGMVRTLRVVSLTGPTVAPLLDCRAFEQKLTPDNSGAYITLKEAMETLKPTKNIWLYRELAEVQGKMGDKQGALLSVQTAAEFAVAEWQDAQNDKTKRELVRQQITLLAADLEALGDKPAAEQLRKMLSKNDFQQIGLPLFITVNVAVLLIGYIIWRSNKKSRRVSS